ncbi:MAG: hypothetical protein ACRENE_17130 [Polyangiaceae bacterium]
MSESRPWRVALCAAALASAVPLWCAHFLPMADLPQHVAAIGMLRHWFDPTWHLASRYALNAGDSQYFVYYAAGAALSFVTGSAETANRVLLTAAAIAFPYALRSLLSAFGRDRRLALFGAPAFWSAPLMMGFAPYVAAVPLTIWALARFVREALAPSRRGRLLLSGIACLLFGLHISAYLLLVGCAAVLAPVLCEGAAAITRSLSWVVPSAALAVAWALHFGVGAATGPSPETYTMAWTSAGTLASQLPLWAHDIWRSHVDEGCAAALWLALLGLVFQRGTPPGDTRLSRAAWVPLAVATLAYALLPYSVGPAVMLDMRMAAFVVLFVPLVLTPRPGLAGTLPLVAVLASHLVGAADSAIEVHRTEAEELGDFDRLLRQIPPDARVLTLPVHLTSKHTHWPPWVFLGSYHLARAGGEAEMSFTRIRHWPIRDTPGTAEQRRPLFWTLAPCTFRNAVDGPGVDYLLVRAPHDIFRAHPPGPSWRLLDREREWFLYEREPGAEWVGADDPGPCTASDGSASPATASN